MAKQKEDNKRINTLKILYCSTLPLSTKHIHPIILNDININCFLVNFSCNRCTESIIVKTK